MVRFVVAFEVCMCRNPVGFLGFSGFLGLFASDLSILAFLCVCAYGYEGTKV